MKIIQPINSEERDFCRHINDLLFIGEKSRTLKFSGFLTEREQQLAELQANIAGVKCSFWGGYENAVRRMFCAGIAENEEFPLNAATFVYRASDKLTHRDFLGALMSLGLKRNQVGDIAVADGGAVVFASCSVMPIILDEIDKVGKVGVKSECGIGIVLPRQGFEEIFLTVASFRTDAVVSGLCGLSREKSAMLIKSGGVVVNGIEIKSGSDNLDKGDIFSVKGYGKFVFSDVGNLTRKGKSHITIKKYI